MTPQALIELIREIERFEQHRRELAGTISAAYDESSPDDSDSLYLTTPSEQFPAWPGRSITPARGC